MTTFNAKVRPIVNAIIDSLDADRWEWTEERWQRFMHVVDEAGRMVFDLPSHYTYDRDLFAAVDEAAGSIADAQSGVMEATAALRAVVAELRGTPAAASVSEARPNIPDPIPAAEPAAQTETVAAVAEAAAEPDVAAIETFQADPFAETPAPATVPLTVERLAAGGHAPAPKLPCDRCGRSFTNSAALTGHRKFCGQPLTVLQQRLVDALREHDGSQKAAADALGKGTGWVSGMLGTIRRKNALPADVEKLIAARPRGTNTAIVDKHKRQIQEAEEQARQAARVVAEHARERETAASAAHDEFVATRQAKARERANANIAARAGR